jgi:hypothetical protein
MPFLDVAPVFGSHGATAQEWLHPITALSRQAPDVRLAHAERMVANLSNYPTGLQRHYFTYNSAPRFIAWLRQLFPNSLGDSEKPRLG